MARACAGDAVAFGVLWEQLSPAVLGYLRVLRCPEPEDVTSEVFLSALRSLQGFQGGATEFRAWLFTVARRRRTDAVRRAVRAPASVRLDPDDHGRPAASADERVLATEGALTLLDLLPDDQREVLALRVVADLPLAEVARSMGRSVGAVKALQHRALAALRDRLEPAAGTAPIGGTPPPRASSPDPAAISEVTW